jgi:hypothetical protein
MAQIYGSLDHFQGPESTTGSEFGLRRPVETLWATCAAAARSLWAASHNILGCAVNEIFAPQPELR